MFSSGLHQTSDDELIMQFYGLMKPARSCMKRYSSVPHGAREATGRSKVSAIVVCAFVGTRASSL